MENFINSLPKPVLAFLAILVGIVVFMIVSPPHTVCDTQATTLRELQAGNIFPTEVKKNKIPPAITRAKEACQLGNSPGSCYEYFLALKKVADDVGKASSECTTQLFNINEVKAALNDGLELMVRLAWGIKPPEPGLERFGWMQEAEIANFCRLKSIFIRANGEEGWIAFRQRVVAKLPGEEIPPPSDPAQVAVEPRPATAVMSEQEIWNRSLFSVRCESF
ncbi:hypothetical protein [Bdellovibrio bacteriovorus]|uniref:hypothetical protein n=1 Tax=Bdellovibrio bacteriovorus TaxID=959 RepID=UPI0035A6FF71